MPRKRCTKSDPNAIAAWPLRADSLPLDLRPEFSDDGAANLLRATRFALRCFLNFASSAQEDLAHQVACLVAMVTVPRPEVHLSDDESDDDCRSSAEMLWRGRIKRRLEDTADLAAVRSLQKLGRRLDQIVINDELAANLRVLSDAFSLSAVDGKLLELGAAVASVNRLYRMLVAANQSGAAVVVLAELVGASVEETSAAIGRRSRLRDLGLLCEDFEEQRSSIEDLLELTAAAKTLLKRPLTSAKDIGDAILVPVPPPPCQLDFSYLGRDAEVVVALLRGASSRHEPGVNLLIHGEPGCGKTEFARWLIAATGMNAYAVSHLDESGGEARREDRLASLRMTQRMLPPVAGGFVVLDEAEDIFPRSGLDVGLFIAKGEHSSGGKAWVNRLLETNPWPTVWISNEIGQIDPAFLRRFQFVLEFPRPPQSARRRMVDLALSGTPVPPLVANQLARLEHLTPALLTNVARGLALSGLREETQPGIVGHLVDRYSRPLSLQNRLQEDDPLDRYDPALLNLEGVASPDELITVVGNLGRGAACFYGPSGTGKTQLARHLAERMNRRLLYRTGSDLLSKWVGDTEANIRRLFASAHPEEDLIFLDEAEGLLGHRANAHARWEVTQTAEFLRCIEQFDGLLICATNHLEQLDAALMRRFALKVGFMPLTAEGRLRLFAQMVENSHDLTNEAARAALNRLDGLCLGDFGVVQRLLRLRGASSAKDALDALTHEWRHKPGLSKRAVGFA